MTSFTEEELKKQLRAMKGEIEEKAAAMLKWEKLYNEMEAKAKAAEAMCSARIAPFLAISTSTEGNLVEAVDLLKCIEVGMDIDLTAPNGDQCDGILLTREFVARVKAFLDRMPSTAQLPANKVTIRKCEHCGAEVPWGRLGPIQYHKCAPIEMFLKCPDCTYNGPYILRPCEKHIVKPANPTSDKES